MKKIIIKIQKLMVRFRYLLLFLFFSLVVFSQVGSASAFYVCLGIFPKVTTDRFAFSNNAAMLTGNIANYDAVQACAPESGGIKQKGIWYWVPNAVGNTTVTLPDYSNVGYINTFTNILIPGEYNYQAYVIEANNKTRKGGIKSFTFVSPTVATPPIVQTLPATQITETSAVINGDVISTGSSELIPTGKNGHGFFFDIDSSCLTDNRGHYGFDGPDGSMTGNYTLTLADLTPDTTYYFRALAININSTSNGFADAQGVGECLSFKTLPDVPQVTISIEPTTANLIVGETKQFTSIITGTENKADSWATNDGESIDGNGLYTATTVGTHTVTVTSQADPTKSAIATVTVNLLATDPTVVTGDKTGSGLSATLAGSITNHGTIYGGATADITENGIYYWNSNTNGSSPIILLDFLHNDNFSLPTSDLDVGTYNYQAFARNSAGLQKTGDIKTFAITAVPPIPPQPQAQDTSSRAIRVIISWDENNQPKKMEFKTFLKSLTTP